MEPIFFSLEPEPTRDLRLPEPESHKKVVAPQHCIAMGPMWIYFLLLKELH